MHDRKPRPKEAPIPPGAKLVWSDKDSKLVLQLPKSASPPSSPFPKPPSASIVLIDEVLAGARLVNRLKALLEVVCQHVGTTSAGLWSTDDAA